MKGATKVEEIRMPYRAYKTSYPDCETLIGSYDKSNKTIVVCIPDGRMKNSGVRGKCFHWYTFKGVENRTGRQVETTGELLRLIEVGASCFNHYCAGYDDT